MNYDGMSDEEILSEILSMESANKDKGVIDFLGIRYPEVNEKYPNMTNKKRLAMFTLGISSEPTCMKAGCVNPVLFEGSVSNCKASPESRKTKISGWKMYCSHACSMSDSLTVTKRKAGTLLSQGATSYMNTPQALVTHGKLWSQNKKDVFNEKSKATNLAKLGVEHHSQSSEWQSSLSAHMMATYGVSNAFQMRENVVAGTISKYGVDNYNKTDEGRKRLSENSAMKNDPLVRAKSKLNRMLSGYASVNPKFVQAALTKDSELLKDLLDEISESCSNNRVLMAKHIGISSPTLNRYMRDLNISDIYLNIGKGSSAGEMEVYSWLKSVYSGRIQRTNKSVLSGKHLDIYLPDKNFAIEYDGIYYHSETMGCDSRYHVDKTDGCEKNGIQLLHIYESEWKNEIKQAIWKSMILHKLGLTKNRIHGRQCVLRKIEAKQSRIFLEENHLQGFVGADSHYGAFYGEDLVSVFSVGVSRFSNDETELLRFAIKKNTKIPGIFAKFLKVVGKNLVTYADRRYSTGNTYKKFFTSNKTTMPSWYGFSKKDYDLRHRMSFQKHKLVTLSGYDEDKTSYQIMLDSGYDRIWDCGTIKFSN